MVDLGLVGPSRPANGYRGAPATVQATLERAGARRMDGTYDALPQRTAWHSRSKTRRPRQLRLGQPVGFTRMLSLAEEEFGRSWPSPSSPERG